MHLTHTKSVRALIAAAPTALLVLPVAIVGAGRGSRCHRSRPASRLSG